MSRCDSDAMVPNTSELLPDPETPVNTVSRRFGSSMLTSLRLFTRAPCTRIRSWLSAGSCFIMSPSVAWLDSSQPRSRHEAHGGSCQPCSLVLEHPEHVAIGVGERGHQAAAADVVRLVLHGAARGGHLGQLRLD